MIIKIKNTRSPSDIKGSGPKPEPNIKTNKDGKKLKKSHLNSYIVENRPNKTDYKDDAPIRQKLSRTYNSYDSL